MKAQQPPQVPGNINLKQTNSVKCECGASVFSEGVILRSVSKFITGQMKDGLIPVPVFYCVKCSLPFPSMIPEEIKNDL